MDRLSLTMAPALTSTPRTALRVSASDEGTTFLSLMALAREQDASSQKRAAFADAMSDDDPASVERPGDPAPADGEPFAVEGDAVEGSGQTGDQPTEPGITANIATPLEITRPAKDAWAVPTVDGVAGSRMEGTGQDPLKGGFADTTAPSGDVVPVLPRSSSSAGGLPIAGDSAVAVNATKMFEPFSQNDQGRATLMPTANPGAVPLDTAAKLASSQVDKVSPPGSSSLQTGPDSMASSPKSAMPVVDDPARTGIDRFPASAATMPVDSTDGSWDKDAPAELLQATRVPGHGQHGAPHRSGSPFDGFETQKPAIANRVARSVAETGHVLAPVGVTGSPLQAPAWSASKKADLAKSGMEMRLQGVADAPEVTTFAVNPAQTQVTFRAPLPLIDMLDPDARTASPETMFAAEPRAVQFVPGVSAPSPSVPVVPPAVEQVIRAMPGLGDRAIEIAMAPEELGRVRMTLTTTDGGLTLMIQAEREDTLALLRRNMDLLGNELRDLGFRNLSFQFSQDGQRHERYQGSDTPMLGSDDTQTEGVDAVTSEPRDAATTAARLDIRL